ncbi:MAG: PucR family transcriptional regulator, partial [Tissierellia bacterium]|nr:PucR family transcriptional regulator [Tissierellia bacterium]
MEMLKAEFFKDFKVIAGHGGLEKQIQGIAILDAPDGYNWTRGREFVISSGYVFKQHPELFYKYLKSDKFRNISGMGIKLDRYINKVPEDILQVFNECNIPLIHIPLFPSWMDIMNQLNVLVMNKNIRHFRIGNINPRSFSNISYQSRKINKILSQMEIEMKFPAMLYDLSSEKAHYSSPAFVELMEDLKIEDFWNPLFEHTKEILCDNLQIIRYRFIDEKYDRPYSWITIPVTVGDKIKAYFVVVEATGLIDYFDQFSLRIGFLLLQSLYEQILVAQSIGDIGFEKFISDIVNDNIKTEEAITKTALELGIDINLKYYLILLQQDNLDGNMTIYKDEFREILNSRISNMQARMALIDEKSCIFLIPFDERLSEEDNLKLIKESAYIFKAKVEKTIDNIKIIFGVSDIKEPIYELKKNFNRCIQAINMGKILYPNEEYITYTSLGPLGWMDI